MEAEHLIKLWEEDAVSSAQCSSGEGAQGPLIGQAEEF